MYTKTFIAEVNAADTDVSNYSVVRNLDVAYTSQNININRKFTMYDHRSDHSNSFVYQTGNLLFGDNEVNVELIRDAMTFNDFCITNGVVLHDFDLKTITHTLDQVRLIYNKVGNSYFVNAQQQEFYKKLYRDISFAVSHSKLYYDTFVMPEYVSRDELITKIESIDVIENRHKKQINKLTKKIERLQKSKQTYRNRLNKYRAGQRKMSVFKSMYRELITEHRKLLQQATNNLTDSSSSDESINNAVSDDDNDDDEEFNNNNNI